MGKPASAQSGPSAALLPSALPGAPPRPPALGWGQGPPSGLQCPQYTPFFQSGEGVPLLEKAGAHAHTRVPRSPAYLSFCSVRLGNSCLLPPGQPGVSRCGDLWCERKQEDV